MQSNYIVIPILNDEHKVVVCFGKPLSIKPILKKFNYNVKVEWEENRGICFYNKGAYPIICLPTKPRTAKQIATLAHEAVHAVTYIFKYIEEPLCGEVFCYSVEAIIRSTLQKIRSNT